MASLKNVSALLSPKFLSPLHPSKNFVSASRSDGRLSNVQIKRPNIVKKLDFSENINQTYKQFSTAANILPEIKIERACDHQFYNNDVKFDDNVNFFTKSSNTLEINTPNKQDLAKNGLKHFKRNAMILGKGTFGTVFRGKHKGNLVAVKIVSKKESTMEENALRLNHKNIVKILDIIRNPDHQTYCLIIMEYLPNCKNLQNVLENLHTEKPDLTNEHVKKLGKSFCFDITKGLHHCHSNGILHLDLKPKNILVNTENVCKICDFGNSVKIEKDLGSFKHNGTIMYTAPEILLGKKPTTKSDIYSLGLIFWQIKYRKCPFRNYDSNEAIIYNVGKYDARPVYYEDKDILTQIFTNCWASDPELRPATGDILMQLEEATF